MRRTVDEIKQRLPMRRVAEHYGFSPERNGFIKCPFHQGDHTASLKIYDGSGGWHCFGCNKGGSVIDFVMELFNLNFKQAIMRLNADFSLNLGMEKPDIQTRSNVMDARRKEQAEREHREAEFRKMINDLRYYRSVLENFPPVRNGDDLFFHPFFVEAVKRIHYVEYWIDNYIEEGA